MHEQAPDDLYPAHLKTLAARASEALSESGFEHLVVHSGEPPVQFLDDQSLPYKVNPHFKHWVPVTDNPGSVLIFTPSSKPRLLFHRQDDYWHKPLDVPNEPWTAAVDVVPIANAGQAAQFWQDLPRAALIGSAAAFPSADAASLNPPALLAKLHFNRAVKTAYELECMRLANDLAARGHRAALAAFRAGASEYDAHMRYLQACMQREEEMPYNNIVAYNENAAVLHYQHLQRVAPADMRSFLIDAGAQYRGYASDVTRTYAGAPGRFADLLAGMERAQQALCAEVQCGQDFRDVHLSAHRALGDVLHAAGVIELGGQEALESGLTSVFFPHGIGHLIGLQVHDVGGVMNDARGAERERPAGHPYLRLTRILEPGVVVTIEPGIYWIDSLLRQAHADERRRLIDWDIVDALRPFGGIRIEDNVAASNEGPENLTRDAFARAA